ncbi:MAG: HAMP domain-containing sensor histidine kinase [Pseudomonadota bacterium]
MKTLYLRIYLTVVAALLLFALLSGWLFQRNIDRVRALDRAAWSERLAGWAELAQEVLPPPTATPAQQAEALQEWSQRLRLPLALDDAAGQRLAVTPAFERGVEAGGRGIRLPLADGRTLWVLRAPRPEGRAPGVPPMGGRHPAAVPHEPPWWPGGGGLLAMLLVLFAAVAAGAYPVVRRLTRRLEALRQGVEAFGDGQLGHRVAVDGRDEVAALAASFNRAAERIESLVRSHQSLLANASHELRSPLARLRLALSLWDTDAPEARAARRQEIERNIRELDALVDEVLLASRLDAAPALQRAPVDLLGLAAEEAAALGADVSGEALLVPGDERLLRRAVRNLLDNARRYAPEQPPSVQVARAGDAAELRVCDRGPGVPPQQRERIFEPFYRLPGHAEYAGGVGLGLSLVRQIARLHGGEARCEPHPGGGSCFVLRLPRA